MPAKKAPKRTTKKTTTKRKMTAAHKKALAEGRRSGAAVDAYLRALHAPKARGRKVSAAQLRTRLTAAQGRARSSVGVDRVVAAQEVRDIRARLAAPDGDTIDLKSLERSFSKVAKKYSANKGLSYRAWRDAGVPADVLRKAGIARTRG